MKNLIIRFWREEQGQDLIEYTLLLAFVALASASIFMSAGNSIRTPGPSLLRASGGDSPIATSARDVVSPSPEGIGAWYRSRARCRAGARPRRRWTRAESPSWDAARTRTMILGRRP